MYLVGYGHDVIEIGLFVISLEGLKKPTKNTGLYGRAPDVITAQLFVRLAASIFT
jgi:hypothetical protein